MIDLRFSIAIVLILAPVSALAAPTSNRELAHTLGEKGKLTKALYYANLDVANAPSEWQAYLIRGKTLNKLDRLKESLVDLNKALSMCPNSAEIYRWRGDTYSDMEKFEIAIVDFDKAEALSPNKQAELSVYEKRAQCFNALGKVDKAIADYGSAIKVAEKRKIEIKIRECYTGRGQVYFNNKMYEKAADDFTHAMCGKVSDQLLMLRASCYEKLGKTDMAINDYSKLIEVNPKDDSAYEKRCKLYNSAGKLDKALSDANKALENYPGENPARLYRLRADIHKKAGHAALAQQDSANAKKIDSDQSF